MAKRTLLELTQQILNDMKSDNVSSISDTYESEQVANIIKRTFLDMVTDPDTGVGKNKKLGTLNGLADTTKPNLMGLPDGLTDLEWIQYDQRTSLADTVLRFSPVSYLEPAEFVKRSLGQTSTDSNVDTVTVDTNVRILVRNVINPSHWTIFDDDNVTFDSYNSAIDTTLQSSKCLIYGTWGPSWTHTDSAVPDLPEDLFPMLLAKSEARAFAWVKQTADPMAMRDARRMTILAQARSNIAKTDQQRPNYGRYK